MKNAFRKSEGKLYLNSEEMHLYIPEYYYDRDLAISMGEYIRTFGLVNFKVFTKGKESKLMTLNIPTEISIYPKTTERVELSLIPNAEPEMYIVAKFFRDDHILDTEITKDSTYVEKFLNLLTGGKIPRTIKYGEILSIWQHNLEINGVHLGVSSMVMEMIVAEIYRDKTSPQDKFAKRIGANPKLSEYSYLPASIRDIAAYNSTFQAIIFEDMDRMITSGLNNTAYDRKQSQSPIEKIIKL